MTRRNRVAQIALDGMEPAPSWPPVRHPFQVSTMVAFTTLGIGFYGRPGVALTEFLDGFWFYAWITILAGSGVLGLIASVIAVKYEDTSLLLERVALGGSGVFCALYALAIYMLAGTTAIGGLVIFLGMTFACGWRFAQVQKRVSWKKRTRR